MTPICCAPETNFLAGETLSCPSKVFPINYPGLPLSVRKASTSALMPLVEKMAKHLGTWQACLLSHEERLTLVRHVLIAMPTHLVLAMALSPSILKLVNRLICDFLWHGCKEAQSRNCLMNWPRVCRPLDLGGLGMHDIQRTDISLWFRWLWLRITDPSWPWHHLHLPDDASVRDIFRASTTWTMGNGQTCRFWLDH